jgi:hypothetical protein
MTARVEMFFTEVGAFLLAVDARHVKAVRDLDARSDAPIDLDLRLGGGSHFPGAWPRRVLELTGSRGDVSLVAGEEVWPDVVDSGRLQAVPDLVAAGLGATGITRLYLGDEGRFGYVLDPEALL